MTLEIEGKKKQYTDPTRCTGVSIGEARERSNGKWDLGRTISSCGSDLVRVSRTHKNHEIRVVLAEREVHTKNKTVVTFKFECRQFGDRFAS